MQKVQASSADFVSHDFTEFPLDNLTADDFVYCDPPYLITTGSYNDRNSGFKNWTKKCTVHHLQKDYSNSSYNTARSGSDEVLVMNYALLHEK